MASREAERQKKIQAVLEREREEFQKLKNESLEFRKETEKKEIRKNIIEMERQNIISLSRTGNRIQNDHHPLRDKSFPLIFFFIFFIRDNKYMNDI